ncbi:MAG: hypothetical protein ACD_71C00132G0004 [uncultured bacterium (gcode 4)]|uniref:Uncharacterized protein n=1 Tax=uncultured bacterium (gcode 4) TaxID=1234023 RepID=K1Z4F1_9BACT|nr:MAG: hypothetical protein ACD_71C00132G0004 [uncultured bacterium (gcode 4)]
MKSESLKLKKWHSWYSPQLKWRLLDIKSLYRLYILFKIIKKLYDIITNLF